MRSRTAQTPIVATVGLAISMTAAPAAAQDEYTWSGGNTQGASWHTLADFIVTSWAGPGSRVILDPPGGVSLGYSNLGAFGGPPLPNELVIGSDSVLGIGFDLSTGQPIGVPFGVGTLLDNDGRIEIGPINGLSTGLTIGLSSNNLTGSLNPTITGSGTITLMGFSGLATFGTTFPGVVITHGPDHTIGGTGFIGGSIINEGTIQSGNGAAGGLMEIGFINENTLSQTATGRLTATGGGGRLDIVSRQPFNRATVTGGTVGGMNGLPVRATGQGAVFSDLTVEGLLEIDPSDPTLTDLTITGTITNNGEFRVDSDQGTPDNVVLFVQSPITIDGDGELVMEVVNSNSLDSAVIRGLTPADTLISEADHTIRGSGTIEVALDNRGLVLAETATGVLLLTGEDKSNSGTMRAENGSRLAITSADIVQSATGVIEADGAGSTVQTASDGQITGGTLRTTNGGSITGVDGGRFADLTNEGTLTLTANSQPTTVTFLGTIVNEAEIVLPSFNTGFVMNLIAEGDVTFGGSGAVSLNAFNNISTRSVIGAADPTDTVINSSNHTLRGNGRISAALDNQGTVSADNIFGGTVAGFLDLTDEPKQNSGVMESNGGALRVIATTVTQSASGLIVARDASEVTLDAATIVGGTVRSEGSGVVLPTNADGSALDSVTLEGRVDIPLNREMTLRNTITNNGDFFVQPEPFSFNFATDMRPQGNVTLTGTGRTVLNCGFNPIVASITADNPGSDSLTITGDQRLEGRIGIGIDTNVVVDAVLAPGSDVAWIDDETGRVYLRSGSALRFGQDSVLEIQLAGDQSTVTAEDFDRITGDAGATVTLGGTLQLQNIDGFGGLTTGESVTIISAPGGVTGTFDATTGPDAAGYRVRYEPTRVVLDARCPADVNGDGSVSDSDFFAWVTAFINDDPECDVNLDGSCNDSDFFAWVTFFIAGGC